jgi:hypothetical protein
MKSRPAPSRPAKDGLEPWPGFDPLGGEKLFQQVAPTPTEKPPFAYFRWQKS